MLYKDLKFLNLLCYTIIRPFYVVPMLEILKLCYSYFNQMIILFNELTKESKSFEKSVLLVQHDGNFF